MELKRVIISVGSEFVCHIGFNYVLRRLICGSPYYARNEEEALHLIAVNFPHLAMKDFTLDHVVLKIWIKK